MAQQPTKTPAPPAKRVAETPTPPTTPTEPATDNARNWTGRDGQLLATAEWIDLIDDKVCLQKPDGAGVVIPLEKLCEADQQYVRKQLSIYENSAATPKPDEHQEGSPQGGSSEEQTAGPGASTVAATPLPSVSLSEQVVIPFDFQSKFDDGRYGRMVGEMIWKRLDREGGFIIPETMVDVRDTCRSNHIHPTPETAMAEMKKHVREDFSAQVGIWGSVERVPGHEWDVYDLVIKCVDFGADPQPRVIYEKTARTNAVSEIPHLYVKEMFDALYRREPQRPPPPDPIAQRNWKKNPNLVVGDFQQGAGDVPSGWDAQWQAGDVDQRQPLGATIRWTAEPDDPTNRVIRFTFSAGVGNSSGVAYYSKFFPIRQGARYRFQCRWRSDGPKAKVFIKCYDEVGTGNRRESESSASGPDDYLPQLGQMREVYRSQQNLKGPKNTWNTHTEDFTPKHTRYTPRFGRVMLYAYLGGGVVEFDGVVVKQILPASPGDGDQQPRHSLETKVTVEQMQENERRPSKQRAP